MSTVGPSITATDADAQRRSEVLKERIYVTFTALAVTVAFERDAAHATVSSAALADNLPENGVPCRFTVHLIDFPDKAASYEFYSTALLQRALQKA